MGIIVLLAIVALLAPAAACAAQQTPPGYYQPPEPGPPTPPPSPPQPPQSSGEPCAATLTESEGIVSLTLIDPARAGAALAVTVDDFGDDPRLDYDAQFDASGKLQLQAPIFHENAPIKWRGADGVACQQSVRFTGYDKAFRAALIWSGAVVLALHVVEPTGAIGSSAHYVSPSRPNLNLSPNAYGIMHEYGGAKLHVQLYSVPSGQNPHDNAPVSFHVENVSRGNPVRPPYCGDSPLATTTYQAIFQQNGQPPKLTRGRFGQLECGHSWADSTRSFSRLSDMRM